jgi:MoxR-like ATPase
MTGQLEQPAGDLLASYAAIAADLVGRETQLQGLLAVLAAGRNLLLEGPPGTGKSTLLRAATRHFDLPLLLVEGNSEMTPQKMIGYHDPSAVLRHGYRSEDFVLGPLPEAMSSGGLLYVEEFNRLPEDTLNTLLTAMSERELHVPRFGTVTARETFRVIAAMNPFDNIGTTRVSASVYDRLCRMLVDYQDEEDERQIVWLRAAPDRADVVRLAVRAVRDSRGHPGIRRGASVRGAIDFVLIEQSLRQLTGGTALTAAHLARVAELALSSKIVPDETWGRSAEDLARELVLGAARSLAVLA